MTRRDYLHLAAMLLSASAGVFLVALLVGREVGAALTYGAAICAIAGVAALALGRWWANFWLKNFLI